MTEPAKTRPDWKELLADRWWRLNHLYWIEDKEGRMGPGGAFSRALVPQYDFEGAPAGDFYVLRHLYAGSLPVWEESALRDY